MPAYLIAETDILDPEQYEHYKAASPGAIAAGGGRFLVRGGELAVLEGDWSPTRVVVVEFESLEAAKAFYESPEYQAAIKLREGAARFNMIAVEGNPLEDVRLLERVAAGEFNIEEPVDATEEITSAPSPTISAHHPRFSQRDEEGV